MTDYKVDFRSLSWESPMEGVRFKACEYDGRRLRFVEFTKEFVEPDWRTKGHIGFVLDGEMEIDFDGEIIHFGPGDGLFIPVGEDNKHMAKILTNAVKLILMEDL